MKKVFGVVGLLALVFALNIQGVVQGSLLSPAPIFVSHLQLPSINLPSVEQSQPITLENLDLPSPTLSSQFEFNRMLGIYA